MSFKVRVFPLDLNVYGLDTAELLVRAMTRYVNEIVRQSGIQHQGHFNFINESCR